jgi:predicted dehydrogenase
MNRRQFLQTTAAGLAFTALRGPAADLAGMKPRVGLIGCGWYGKIDLLRLLQVAPVEVVSLCDVDRNLLAGAAELVAGKQRSKQTPRTYGDYRAMLKERDLNLVLIATPDHWHALQMIAAVEAGADVYVQKPTSVDVAESLAMLRAARRHGRVVQVGTQRRSTPHLIAARDEIIRPGKLGKIAHAELCCYYPMRTRENPPDTAPPAYLDYEMWTGPAPLRPYNKLVHPRGWRAFMEYGNGIVGDMCVHMLDLLRWWLDLGWPTRVSSAGGIFQDKASKANISDTQTATFEFPELNAVWIHRTWGDAPDPKHPWALVLYGEKGTLKASVHSWEFYPRGQSQPAATGSAVFEYDQFPEDRTEPDLERHVASAIRGHMRDWLACTASRGKPVADIEQGVISSVACILANLSLQLGRTLAWDPVKQEVIGDAEASRWLRRSYRAPWTHPAAA